MSSRLNEFLSSFLDRMKLKTRLNEIPTMASTVCSTPSTQNWKLATNCSVELEITGQLEPGGTSIMVEFAAAGTAVAEVGLIIRAQLLQIEKKKLVVFVLPVCV